MPKSIKQRVEAAFSTEGRTAEDVQRDATEFLKGLRDTWKEVSTTLNRTLFLMLGLAAVFELLVTTKGKQFSVAGFTFEDTSLIQKALPVLVAYLYLEVVLLSMRFEDMSTLHAEVMTRATPAIEENDLDLYLAPPSRALLTGGSEPRPGNLLRSEQAMSRLHSAMLFPSFLLPIAFEVQAFYLLFHTHGWRDVFTWASAAAASLLVVAAWAIAIIWSSE